MLYVYAVAEELTDVKGLAGVQGETLAVLSLKELLAVAGDVTGKPPLDAATLKAQDALIRALHARADALLPMRFGTTASDPADLQRAIDAQEGLTARLHAVRGCEQMIVRVFATPEAGSLSPPVPHSSHAMTSGRGYLEARAALRKPSAELAAIAAAGKALDRDVRVEPAHQPGFHGSVYHLIERGRAEAYRAAITRAAERQRVHVVITGPSPPYAFA